MIFNAITPEMIDMAALGNYFATTDEFSRFVGRANRIISSVHNLNRTRESDYIIPRGAVLRTEFENLNEGINVNKDKVYEFPVYQFKLTKSQLDSVPTANVGTYFTALLNINNLGIEYDIANTEIVELKHDFLSIRDLSFRFVSRYNYDINQMVFDIVIDRDVIPFIEVMEPTSIVKLREAIKDRFYVTTKSYIDEMGDQQITIYLNIIPEPTNDTYLNIIGSFGNAASPLHVLSDLDISFNETSILTKSLRESVELINPTIPANTAILPIDAVMPNDDAWSTHVPLYTTFKDNSASLGYMDFIQPVDNTKYDKCTNVMIAITADPDVTVNETKDSLEFVYFDTHQKKLCFATNVYMLGSTEDPNVFQYQTIQDFQKFVDGPQHVVGDSTFDQDVEILGKTNARGRHHNNESMSTDTHMMIRNELRLLKNHDHNTDPDGNSVENEEHIAIRMDGEDLVITEVDPHTEGEQVDEKEWVRFHDSNDNDRETYVSMFGRKMAERDWVDYLFNASASIEGGGIVSLDTDTNIVTITENISMYLTDSEDNVKDENGVIATRKHTFNTKSFTVPDGYGIFIQSGLERDVNPLTSVDVVVLELTALESSVSLIPVAIRWSDGTLLWVPSRKTIPTVHVLPRPTYKHIPAPYIASSVNWLDTLTGDCSWEIEAALNRDYDLKVAHEKKTWEGDSDVLIDLNNLTITNNGNEEKVIKTTRIYNDGIRVSVEINDNTNHIGVGLSLEGTEPTSFGTSDYYIEANQGVVNIRDNVANKTILSTGITHDSSGAKLSIEYDGRYVIGKLNDVEIGRIRVSSGLEFYGLIIISDLLSTKTAHYCIADDNAAGRVLSKTTEMLDVALGSITVTGVNKVNWDNNGNKLTLEGDGIIALSTTQSNGQEYVISNNSSIGNSEYVMHNHNDTLIYVPDYNVDDSNGTTGSFVVTNPSTENLEDYKGAIILARYDSTISGLLWIPGNIFIPDEVPSVPSASYRNIPSPFQVSTINTYNATTGECSWITRQFLTHLHESQVDSEICTWEKLGSSDDTIIGKNNRSIMGNGTTGWTSGVYSHISYRNGAKIEFVVRDLTSEQLIGLDTSPNSIINDISVDYKIYQMSNSLKYASGSNAQVAISTLSVGDRISIEYDGYSIIIRKNDIIIKTVELVNHNTVYYGIVLIHNDSSKCNDIVFSDNSVGVAKGRIATLESIVKANITLSGGGIVNWTSSSKKLVFSKAIVATTLSKDDSIITIGTNAGNTHYLTGGSVWTMLIYRTNISNTTAGEFVIIDETDDISFDITDGDILIAYYDNSRHGLVWIPDNIFIPDAVIVPNTVAANVPSPFTVRANNSYNTETDYKSWEIDRVKNLIHEADKRSIPCSWLFSTALCKVEEDDRTISKISGSGWSASVYSKLKTYGSFELTFKPTSLNKSLMVGIKKGSGSNTDSYSVLAYAFYLQANQKIGIYENGSNKASDLGTYNTNTELAITYDGEHVKYYINRVLKRTIAATHQTVNIAEIAINNAGGMIHDISFRAAVELVSINNIINDMNTEINTINGNSANIVRHATSNNSGHSLNQAIMSFKGSAFKFSNSGTSHNLNTYFTNIKSAFVMASENPAGKLGEVYTTISGTTVTVHRSGSTTVKYQLQVIGTPKKIT